MKYFFHILLVFTISIVASSTEAQASCCSGESTEQSCHKESEGDNEKPCGDSSCDCICCAHVSLILSKKELPTPATIEHIHTEVFFSQNFIDLLFKSSIWQPPKLG